MEPKIEADLPWRKFKDVLDWYAENHCPESSIITLAEGETVDLGPGATYQDIIDEHMSYAEHLSFNPLNKPYQDHHKACARKLAKRAIESTYELLTLGKITAFGYPSIASERIKIPSQEWHFLEWGDEPDEVLYKLNTYKGVRFLIASELDLEQKHWLDRYQQALTEASMKSTIRKQKKSRKVDDLSRLIKATLKGLTAKKEKSDYRNIIAHLADYDDPNDIKSTIQEIDFENGMIHWVDRNGRDRNTTFTAFTKRLSKIRKT